MKQVLIYCDKGVSPHSFQSLFSAFREHTHSTYRVQSVDHRFFYQSGWEETTALIVFPGGRDLPFHQLLKGEGNASIRAYVENGGRFLGICAGGYYGSSYIEFEKGGDLEVCGPRELAFFPGKAIGPAYGKGIFCYHSEMGTYAAPIKWKGGVSFMYFKGGCFFEKAEEFSSIEVLANYADLPESPAAVVYCRVGRGAAILSGIHPEFVPKPPHPFLSYLIEQITK